jgi:membrane-bound lytic murein transglycosylase D
MRSFMVLMVAGVLLAGCARQPAAVQPVPLPPDPAPDFMLEEAAAAQAAAEADELVSDELDYAPSAVDSLLGFALDHSLFDLPITVNERVAFWIQFFATRHRDWFATYLRRMGRYEEHILSRLEARGLPQDLIYLALIESGFTPRAYSKAHAVGIWQFIPGTGRRFGLEQTPYVDERRDPLKSTEAALSYLEELQRRFGSWYLAAAAYNCGENRVERLLQQHAGGARGHDSLYWHISEWLPAETRNYVPKMLAAAIVAKHRDQYGFADVEPDPAERWETTWIPDATDLAIIAELSATPEAEIRLLNPQFLQGITPPRRRVQVRLPVGSVDAFDERYALLPPDRRVRFLHHTVARGETLSGIARQYGTTVAALQDANGIRNPSSLRAGARLVIPGAGASTVRTAAATPRPAATGAPASSSHPTSGAASGSAARPAGAAGTGTDQATHRVRAGETLWSIARSYDVTVVELRAWNRLDGDRIVAGQQLVVRPQATATLTVLVHEVRTGDTLWSIARSHGVTARQLMEWNKLAEDAVLRPGDRVEIRR